MCISRAIEHKSPFPLRECDSHGERLCYVNTRDKVHAPRDDGHSSRDSRHTFTHTFTYTRTHRHTYTRTHIHTYTRTLTHERTREQEWVDQMLATTLMN